MYGYPEGVLVDINSCNRIIMGERQPKQFLFELIVANGALSRPRAGRPTFRIFYKLLWLEFFFRSIWRLYHLIEQAISCRLLGFNFFFILLFHIFFMFATRSFTPTLYLYRNTRVKYTKSTKVEFFQYTRTKC